MTLITLLVQDLFLDDQIEAHEDDALRYEERAPIVGKLRKKTRELVHSMVHHMRDFSPRDTLIRYVARYRYLPNLTPPGGLTDDEGRFVACLHRDVEAVKARPRRDDDLGYESFVAMVDSIVHQVLAEERAKPPCGGH